MPDLGCCATEKSSLDLSVAFGYGPEMESRSGARVFAPIQTGPWAHPASYTMGTGSLLGVKSGRGV